MLSIEVLLINRYAKHIIFTLYLFFWNNVRENKVNFNATSLQSTTENLSYILILFFFFFLILLQFYCVFLIIFFVNIFGISQITWENTIYGRYHDIRLTF